MYFLLIAYRTLANDLAAELAKKKLKRTIKAAFVKDMFEILLKGH